MEPVTSVVISMKIDVAGTLHHHVDGEESTVRAALLVQFGPSTLTVSFWSRAAYLFPVSFERFVISTVLLLLLL
jgi:hypothetical protein